ncbi:BatD family protein [Rubripirellula sp.]|nr:BatD family protein [Rubripirellula sp.]
MIGRRILFWLGLASCWWFTTNGAECRAADVDTDVSVRETVVGLPVILRIQISNSVAHEPPEFPRVDGLKIEQAGPPSRSRRISIQNNRRVEKSNIIYSFRITPLREGTFIIPPVRVSADGISRVTRVVRIVATKGETNDLLFVEVEGDANEIYVGESLRLTLKIWIRPYRDRQLQQRLSEGDMWNQIAQQSNWGSFQSIFDEMNANRQRPGGRSVLRKDSAGNELEYYLYEIDTLIYPDRAERIDGGDVRVVLEYPTRIGRSRSPFSLFNESDFFGGGSPFGDSPFDDPFFGGGMRVVEVNPIVGLAVVDPIVVKPVPAKNRPDDYRGAVGQYSIITQASPTEVRAGEPITLRIAIDGAGPLDLVRAPPIEQQPDLVRDFKVPDEPLAGFVDQQRKVFSTSIRPLRAGVTEIPGIAFSYFDPDKESFVTTSSNPIAIRVGEADVLELDGIAGAATTGKRGRDPEGEPESQDGKVAERTSMRPPSLASGDLLNFVPRATFVQPAAFLLLGTGPLAAVLVLLVRSRSTLRRFVPARRRLRSKLTTAMTTDQIAVALELFLAEHYRLAESSVRRDQAIGRLRGAGQADLAIRVERFYSSCDSTKPSGDMDALDALRREASEIADELILVRRNGAGLGPVSRAAVFMLLGFFSVPVMALHASEIELSLSQQQILLNEALPIDSALEGEALDRQLEVSKVKLQTLVDSGVQNDDLYFNLGSLYQRTGDLGRAAAYYRRALRLNPIEPRYQTWLGEVETELGLSRTRMADSGWGDWLSSWHAVIPLRWSLTTFVIAWFAFWLLVVLRLLGMRSFSTPAAICCFLVLVEAGIVFGSKFTEFVRDDTAVLVVDRVTLRDGDGEAFGTVIELASAAGRPVKCIASRGRWIQIQLDNGTVGWVPADTAVTI